MIPSGHQSPQWVGSPRDTPHYLMPQQKLSICYLIVLSIFYLCTSYIQSIFYGPPLLLWRPLYIYIYIHTLYIYTLHILDVYPIYIYTLYMYVYTHSIDTLNIPLSLAYSPPPTHRAVGGDHHLYFDHISLYNPIYTWTWRGLACRINMENWLGPKVPELKIISQAASLTDGCPRSGLAVQLFTSPARVVKRVETDAAWELSHQGVVQTAWSFGDQLNLVPYIHKSWI